MARTLTRTLDLSRAPLTKVALELRSPPLVQVEDGAGDPIVTGTLVSIVDDRALSEAKLNQEGLAHLPHADESGALVALREGEAVYFDRVRRPREGERSARFRLPGARVSGRVLGAEGEAVEGALVSCSPRRAALRRSHRPGPLWLGSRGESVIARGVASLAVSDERGRFTLRRPAWCVALEAQPPPADAGEIPAGRARVSLEGTNEDIEIRLTRGFQARARVTSMSGGAVGSGRIEVRQPASWTPRAEFSIIAGESSVELEGPGPWILVARVPDHAPAISPPFFARAGKQVEVALDVEEGAFLVIEPEGAWPSDESTRVLDSARRDWSRTAEALPFGEGRLMLGPLPLGLYEVRYEGGPVRVRLRSVGEVVEAARPAS